MIHMDPPDHRKPLPLVELPDLEALIHPVLERIKPQLGSVATLGSHIKIKLYSDSAHLCQFFTRNWGGAPERDERSVGEAVIVALGSDFMTETLTIQPGNRYIDSERKLIVSIGSEYYGNVKISVRGLSSSVISQQGCGGFLHGASMIIGGAGLVICGTSGAGKTTATRALMDLYPGDVRIINDDWGWADPDTATIVFTRESHIHMKYRSVRAIAPQLRLSPDCYLSENFQGEMEDPHARLLIRREEVFDGAIANSSSFDALIVVVRDTSKPFFVRTLDVGDIDILEVAEYSAFYDKHERFMDGSLLLVDDADVSSERHRFRRLLEKIPAVLVNNVSTPTRLAHELKRQLTNLGV